MKEIEGILESKNIDNNYHERIFGDNIFESVYTKVNLKQYSSIKNRIYWFSLLIYRISMINYLNYINEDVDTKNQTIKIKKNNLIVFHLAMNITSEFCKQFNSNIVYPSYISMLCRQIIEQICLIREVKTENVDEQTIVEAAIESYNKQLGADSLNIEHLNNRNKGSLKGFQDKKSYGKLAKKYKYNYLYNFFSGDIHMLSQINKLIPFQTRNDSKYYNIYFDVILSLLNDYLLIINEYNTEIKIDFSQINNLSFIDIKDSK